MSYLDEIKNFFEGQQKKLEDSIKKEKVIRDTSPSAMQSHHDTTRNQTEKLIQAYETELKQLKELIRLIPNKRENDDQKIDIWTKIQVKIGQNNLTVVLVPSGLGGKKISDFQTLAADSPLGQKLSNLSEGNKFEINGNNGKVVSFS